MGPDMLQDIGKRCNRNFGWERACFGDVEERKNGQ